MSEARMASEDDFNRHNMSYGSFAQAAAANPAFELVPTEFEPSTLFLGFSMHGTLSRRQDGKFEFKPDIVPLGKIEVYGNPPGRVTNVNGWGFDWKKEQKAIAEESRVRAELQRQMDYEMGKAKCLANPMEYGVGMILSDGTWISHEKAMDLARQKPSVNHRNIAGPDEIPFLVTEHGVITEAELLPTGDRAALARYAECDEQAKLSAKHTGTIVDQKYNPDGSESMSIVFTDPNSGIENHVSGTAYVDDLVAVPPLNPHALLEEGMRQLLENAGIPDQTTDVPNPEEVIAEFKATVPSEREMAFARKIIPPITITDHDLDRSVPTKPQPKDYPCNPEGYIRHCRLYNQMVAGTSEPPIPESEIQAIEEASMKLKLMTHADPDHWKKMCLGVKAPDEGDDVQPIIVKESKDASGPDPA